jgi:5'-deoxynucleotidase YfbR-like HD superfamily hydrolase
LNTSFIRELHEIAVITTYSGRHIDALRPTAELIVIDDIAASLARQNRFIGHTNRDYKVAEHCILGLDYCTPQARFEFLMHDAAECLLGDAAGPIKRLSGMKFFRDLEAAWDEVIRERFGIGVKHTKEVHAIDQRMLVTEQRDLQGRRPISTDKFKPFPMHLPAVAPSSDHLQERFLALFYELARQTEGAIR